MQPKRGYYSLIQFCPDPSRLEAVNVGVVLLCPEVDFLAARTSANNQRARKLVGRGEFDRHALNAAKLAIERRLDVDRQSFNSHEDLKKFVDTRGNNLKLTNPRPVKIFDPPKELDKLYAELVGGRPSTQPRRPPTPQLDDLFERLHQEGRAELDINVNVPLLDQTWSIPYAYRNGDLNLIKPQRFSFERSTAMRTASNLALGGDLLQHHSGDNETTSKKLIVVTVFKGHTDNQDTIDHVKSLLDAYRVKTVLENEIDEFASQIEHEAHSHEN